MSADEHTSNRRALALGLVLILLTAVIAVGLLLREHGPGNMGTGFLQGAAVGLVAAGIGLWRVCRRPELTTTFERAWTRSGDERDDAVLTRSLAVLGLLAFPLTAAAAISIALGAGVEMMLALLLLAEVAVGAVSFIVITRSS